MHWILSTKKRFDAATVRHLRRHLTGARLAEVASWLEIVGPLGLAIVAWSVVIWVATLGVPGAELLSNYATLSVMVGGLIMLAGTWTSHRFWCAHYRARTETAC